MEACAANVEIAEAKNAQQKGIAEETSCTVPHFYRGRQHQPLRAVVEICGVIALKLRLFRGEVCPTRK